MLHNFNPAKPRRLKVYYGHQGNSYKRLPVIRLSGKYLAKAGQTDHLRPEQTDH